MATPFTPKQLCQTEAWLQNTALINSTAITFLELKITFKQNNSKSTKATVTRAALFIKITNSSAFLF